MTPSRRPNGDSGVTRRTFLGWAGATVAGGLLNRSVAAAQAPGGAGAFRIAHLADIHVMPEHRGGEGFSQCLEHVHALDPRPDLILTGGDLAHDVQRVDEARAKVVFDLFTRICRESDIPMYHCVGNHDIFGWRSEGRVSPDHVMYGKAMVQERLDLARTTYSFDHKGWHFVMLDDIQPSAKFGYYGGLTEEELDWLDRDLAAAAGRPKVICTHIPILSVAVFRDARDLTREQIPIGPRSMCRNPGAILSVLRRHKVELVLTGHAHQNQRMHYDHTTHIGQGAVCARYWQGPHLGNPEGYGLIDLKGDGGFDHAYMTYGWQAAV